MHVYRARFDMVNDMHNYPIKLRIQGINYLKIKGFMIFEDGYDILIFLKKYEFYEIGNFFIEF